MGIFDGKTALVTGASRGIGRGIARRLAEDGALVAVHYATGRDAALEVVEEIETDGGQAFAVGAELGEVAAVEELFDQLVEQLRERSHSASLDILVNNAAVGGPPVLTEDVTPELFDRYYAVNARAPFFVAQRALALIPDGGRIVNISSGITRSSQPDQIAYAISKSAIEQLTLHLALHVAPRNITVNTVAPGRTDNQSPVFRNPEAVRRMAEMSAFKRVGQPEDIADVVAFLASDASRWVTGSFIDATGGTLLG
ncbi:SDR family oxidoreductase [Kitasatospora sp. LaBMicrA B282]|uniref:SDR family oxidoreductase n=1 Tax=Kitasatospora sp. LaBMicrA B282 TaxID=3420949 RepID=UPI003D0D1423